MLPAGIRQQFPALADRTFLDAACVGLAPRAATDAVRAFLDRTLYCPSASSTLHHIAMDELRSAARPQAAALIGASDDEIALVESTTHGFSIAAQSLPLSDGDRVLLCDLEFMQVGVPWVQLAERRGIGIDVARHEGGTVGVDQLAPLMGPRTRVLVLSSVQWSNGFRADLDAIGALCRERGVWFVVDAIQQLGAMPIDVGRTPIDLLLCGGHKWLNSPFGCGFAYLCRERQSELREPLAGYLAVEPPEGGWGEYFQTPSITPVRDYAFTREARAWEIGGTANYPGAIALGASIQLIRDAGTAAIAEHVRALTDQLVEGLDRLGIDVVTPRAPEHRSGIVTFSVGDAAANVALMERLLSAQVLVSVRYTSGVGGVRVSSHLYNNADDIGRLLEVLSDWKRLAVSG